MSLNDLQRCIQAKSEGKTGVAVAMSGGVDSGLVAYAAQSAVGDQAVACTIVSELTTTADIQRAQAVSAYIGIRHQCFDVTALADENIRKNSTRRCYYCKRLVFRTIRQSMGIDSLILDGTNADDDPSRPGLAAVEEFQVCSPLLDLAIIKSRVREMARKIGLPNWGTPSESCLATRIQTGTPLSLTGLKQVASMESFLKKMGVSKVRAKHDNLMATVEYDKQYSEIMVKNRDQVVTLCQKIGFGSCLFKEWER